MFISQHDSLLATPWKYMDVIGLVLLVKPFTITITGFLVRGFSVFEVKDEDSLFSVLSTPANCDAPLPLLVLLVFPFLFTGIYCFFAFM